MKIPYSWLSEYVDLDGVDPNDVARRLTLHTCEVEGVHRIGAGLESIVVGEVVACAKHPNADNLSVTRVNVGIGELLPIVCGAPNVAKGQKVAIVLPGTRLPGARGGERKIRGEVSRGMICSEKELGLGDDHDGIVVLEPEAAVGAKLVALPSIQDWVLEIDNKSVNHRPDLWGIHGFAREVGAILGKSLTRLRDLVDPRIDEWWSTHPANSQGSFPVEVEDPARCPRYLATVFEGISIGPSPAWMARRLRLVGARPISNVVDLTNYVMFELGQPTHAFDRAKLRGGRIVVRTARAGVAHHARWAIAKVGIDRSPHLRRRGPVGLAGVMGAPTARSTRRPARSSSSPRPSTVPRSGARRRASRCGARPRPDSRRPSRIRSRGSPSTGSPHCCSRKLGSGGQGGARGPGHRRARGQTQQTAPGARGEEPAAAVAGDAENTKIPLSWSFVAERLGLDRKTRHRGGGAPPRVDRDLDLQDQRSGRGRGRDSVLPRHEGSDRADRSGRGDRAPARLRQDRAAGARGPADPPPRRGASRARPPRRGPIGGIGIPRPRDVLVRLRRARLAARPPRPTIRDARQLPGRRPEPSAARDRPLASRNRAQESWVRRGSAALRGREGLPPGNAAARRLCGIGPARAAGGPHGRGSPRAAKDQRSPRWASRPGRSSR